MSGHTPGAWKITEYARRGSYVSGVLRGQFGDHEATYPIINSPGVIDGLRVEMTADDFRLIVHSPETAAELERVREINAELVGALKEARKELEGYHHQLTNEDYNSPAMNDLIARAETFHGD